MTTPLRDATYKSIELKEMLRSSFILSAPRNIQSNRTFIETTETIRTRWITVSITAN
jgi:hypothetical protein